MQRQGLHHATPSVGTVQHNPSNNNNPLYKNQKTARNQFRNRVRGQRSWPTHGRRAGQGLWQPPWAGRQLRPFRSIEAGLSIHGRDRSMAVLVWPGDPGPFFGLAKSISLGGPRRRCQPIRGITSTHQPLSTNPLACPPPPHDAPLHCIAGLVWVIANAPYLNTIY